MRAIGGVVLFAAIARYASFADEQRQPAACSDDAEVAAECPHWAAQGECSNNPDYMHAHCTKSCDSCPPPPGDDPPCVDRDKSGACAHWASAGGEREPPVWSAVEHGRTARGGQELTRRAATSHAHAECEKNPAFMKLRCAASCDTCDMLDYKKRCPMPANRTPAVPPGRIDETFERALLEFPELEPHVLSRPPERCPRANARCPRAAPRATTAPRHGRAAAVRRSADCACDAARRPRRSSVCVWALPSVIALVAPSAALGSSPSIAS